MNILVTILQQEITAQQNKFRNPDPTPTPFDQFFEQDQLDYSWMRAEQIADMIKEEGVTLSSPEDYKALRVAAQESYLCDSNAELRKFIDRLKA